MQTFQIIMVEPKNPSKREVEEWLKEIRGRAGYRIVKATKVNGMPAVTVKREG